MHTFNLTTKNIICATNRLLVWIPQILVPKILTGSSLWTPHNSSRIDYRAHIQTFFTQYSHCHDTNNIHDNRELPISQNPKCMAIDLLHYSIQNHLLDNLYSQDLFAAFSKHNINYQLVPPDEH